MFKPSPARFARRRQLGFTTKQVNGGFYRGSRTGAMGAHTEWGGYIIDWRKVRHFNVPDLKDFKLTPFVTREMEPTSRTQVTPEGDVKTPKKVDAMEFLRQWKQQNPEEYEQVLEHQAQQAMSPPIEEMEESGMDTDIYAAGTPSGTESGFVKDQGR